MKIIFNLELNSQPKLPKQMQGENKDIFRQEISQWIYLTCTLSREGRAIKMRAESMKEENMGTREGRHQPKKEVERVPRTMAEGVPRIAVQEENGHHKEVFRSW